MDFSGITFLWVFYGSKEAQGIGTVAKEKHGRVAKCLLSSAEHPRRHAQHVQLPVTGVQVPVMSKCYKNPVLHH